MIRKEWEKKWAKILGKVRCVLGKRPFYHFKDHSNCSSATNFYFTVAEKKQENGMPKCAEVLGAKKDSWNGRD